MRSDTIVAVATPPGEGGIGIVRLSGAESARIAGKIFRGSLRDRRAVFGHVRDPRDGEPVDEVLALLMRAPRTYTREETVEFQAHGGSVVLRRIVELCLREGARAAEPGEFTLRAFLNGRLDLAQAEAVLDVIQARSDASLRLALQGLSGRLSGRLRPLRVRLLDLLAYLSARADFPDEDVPPDDIAPALRDIVQELEEILATASYGVVYREGLRVAIVGRPNVGKSSLLNRLLGEERAIVTPVPGTTRDTLEETANLGGVPVILIDTAGLNVTEDIVEQIGVSRAREAAARSDALLVVLDGSRPLEPDEQTLLQMASERRSVVAINKTDLALSLPSPLSPNAGGKRESALSLPGPLSPNPGGEREMSSNPPGTDPSSVEAPSVFEQVTADDSPSPARERAGERANPEHQRRSGSPSPWRERAGERANPEHRTHPHEAIPDPQTSSRDPALGESRPPSDQRTSLPAGLEPVHVSALTGAGLDELTRRLAELVTRRGSIAADTPTVTNPRHQAALERALAGCQEALAGLERGLPEDLVAVDLRAGVNALGEITGESVTEDLLDSIFRNFCIGK